MTEQEFEKIVGRPPEDDDMDRVNCDRAGKPGHHQCGVCEHGRPKFTCNECWALEQDSTHT